MSVRYYATASGPKVRDAMRAGLLGQIVTPAAGNRVVEGVPWIADNAVFAGKYPGDEKYLAWLRKREHREACQFAVAPDVVGDAVATLARSRPMLPRIRALGVPVAYVAQDGATIDTLPWGEFDALFIGGSTDWKIGAVAGALTAEAKRRGLPVHMGRVNSRQRLELAAGAGCDSADGTYLAFGPDVNLPRLLGWLADINPIKATTGGPSMTAPTATAAYARTWGDETERDESPRVTVLVDNRANLEPPDGSRCAAAVRLLDVAVAAGWAARLTYAWAAVTVEPMHILTTAAVWLAREGQRGWVSWESRDGGTHWRFTGSWVAGRPYGARELPKRLQREPGWRELPAEPPAVERKRAATIPPRPRVRPVRPGTWGDAHVGDTLQGGNLQPYVVEHVRQGGVWVGAGTTETVVTFAGGLTVRQPSHVTAPILARGDHAEVGAAFAAVIEQFRNVEIIEDGVRC